MTPERREARVRHHLYETCEGIAEHAERIVALEELAADMHRGMCIAYLRGRPLDPHQYEGRMRELGVEP